MRDRYIFLVLMIVYFIGLIVFGCGQIRALNNEYEGEFKVCKIGLIIMGIASASNIALYLATADKILYIV